MKKEFFPGIIRALPETDFPIEGLRGWLVQNERILVSILESEKEVEVGEHWHGTQWGVVLSGTLELTLEGEVHHLKKGDTYFIPAGAKHSGKLSAGHRAIDFFEEPDRYKAKK
jgi:quercetin dioxygenase-like cupin family protein